MSIKNIKNLIIKEKKEYFEEKYNTSSFWYQVKNLSRYFSTTEMFCVVFPLFFISIVLGTALGSLFVYLFFSTYTPIEMLLYLFLTCITFPTTLYLFLKTKEKRIIKKIKTDENDRNEYLEYILNPLFEEELISNELLQYIKINLTIDQFKVLMVMNKGGITYRGLSEFIENIKDIDLSIKNAEFEKHSLNYDEIANISIYR